MVRACGKNGRGNVESNKGNGRPQKRWRDEVKDSILGRRLREKGGNDDS